MTTEHLELLKKEVESVFGRTILSSSDCQFLSGDIYRRTGTKISFNTLRRLFNLMRCKYQPSAFTVDLLSRYCNFSSYSDFINCETRKTSVNKHLDKNLLNLLIFLFKNVDFNSVNDNGYVRLIQETINNLEQWPDVIDQFHREISRSANGQKFYFERLINIDELNKSYGKGLLYYLNEKKTDEAQIFGHSLLCLNAWLTLDNENVKRHSAIVQDHYNNNSQLLDPYIHGKTFTSRLLAASVDKADLAPILNQARKYYDKNIQSIFNSQRFPSFEFALSETLILINEFDEALFYIDEIIHKSQNDLGFATRDLALQDTVALFKSIALTNIGETTKGKGLLSTLDIGKFHFLSKKFYSILYLLLVQKFENSETRQDKIRLLISHTGFKKLIINQRKIKIDLNRLQFEENGNMGINGHGKLENLL